ncbi:MAG: ParA family protein [Longispora sp.]|nr:ParA family protein [Longispora sp. (in: high G+C Gram-positive bacteria)]
MSFRVTLGNNKGGSGKTATAVGLAAALAEQGLRVLVVDLDPQANASRRLGRPFDSESPAPTIAEAIKAGSEGVAADAVVPCGWPDDYAKMIDLIPSRFDLENRVSEAGTVGAVARLRRALTGVDDDHDVTLIDCPPSLGHLTQMGMAASTHALCTVEPEYDSVEGAVRFRDFITHHSADMGCPDLRVTGCVITRVRSNLSAHSYQINGLTDLFGDLVWTPHIPERAAVKDAADTASPLRVVGGSSAVALADIHAQLAQRLWEARS